MWERGGKNQLSLCGLYANSKSRTISRYTHHSQHMGGQHRQQPPRPDTPRQHISSYRETFRLPSHLDECLPLLGRGRPCAYCELLVFNSCPTALLVRNLRACRLS